MSNKKGLTLIELILVVTIIAILGLIALPQFNKIVLTAKERAFEKNHRTVANAAETYVMFNNGVSPTVPEDLEEYIATTDSSQDFVGDGDYGNGWMTLQIGDDWVSLRDEHSIASLAHKPHGTAYFINDGNPAEVNFGVPVIVSYYKEHRDPKKRILVHYITGSLDYR